MQKKTSFKLTISPRYSVSSYNFANFIKNFVEPDYPGISGDKLPNWDYENDYLSYVIHRHNTDSSAMRRMLEILSQKYVGFLREHGTPEKEIYVNNQHHEDWISVGATDIGYLLFEFAPTDDYLATDDGHIIATVAANGFDVIAKEHREDVLHQHIDGVCPCCGAEIEYEGSYEHDDSGATLQFRCPKCGTSGKAGHTAVFDSYYDLQNKDGTPVENEKNAEDHVDEICPCCGAKIEYEGSYDYDDTGATLRFSCPTCGVTGKAGYDFVFDKYYDLTDKNGNPVKN